MKLSKAIQYKGTEVAEIEFDYDSLTGNDLIQAESSFRKAYPEGQLFGSVHMLYVASRACHIPAETLRMMGAKDFMRTVNEAYTFFGNMDSEESQPEITEG